jgi:hypothetical protein
VWKAKIKWDSARAVGLAPTPRLEAAVVVAEEAAAVAAVAPLATKNFAIRSVN